MKIQPLVLILILFLKFSQRGIPFLLILFFNTLLVEKLPAQLLNHVQGELLIQLAPASDIHRLTQHFQWFNGQPTRLYTVREVASPLRIWLVKFDFSTINERDFLQAIQKHTSVEIAQYNHLVFERQTIPNDPYFPNQWHLLNAGGSGGLSDADIDAELAWDITTGGHTSINQEIVVCVIERFGSNVDHTDLADNHWVNEKEIPNNGIDDDDNGYIDDYQGWNTGWENDLIPNGNHGTNVTGMIGASGDNGIGGTGLNWRVKIMQVVRESLTSGGNPDEANVIAAYAYPLKMRQLYNETNGERGAFVVATNASWGLDQLDPGETPLWCAIYDSLGQVGILSCVATANEDWNVDEVGDVPSACPSDFVISVTATDDKDKRTFAAFGPENVDVAAPGKHVYTTEGADGYSFHTGTSFATPLVSGLVALMYASPCIGIGANAISKPVETALKVKEWLFEGVDQKANLQGEIATGGRLNAFQSVQLMLENCDNCPAPYGYVFAEIKDVKAKLMFSITDSTKSIDIRWRAENAMSWHYAENIESPFDFTALKACTDYQFQLRSLCNKAESSWSSTFQFRTDGCCESPQEIEIQMLTADGVQIIWDEVLAAESYNVALSEPGLTSLFEGITENFFYINLQSCTDYAIQIQSNCNGGGTDFSPILTFTTAGCGACIDANYCPASSQFATEEWIANVHLNTLNNFTTSDGGYGDYTHLETNLMTFTAYPISLTPQFDGFEVPEYFKVWIDFNQDGDFEDEKEEVFDAGGLTTMTVNGTVIIPGDALLGSTRMRVIMRWSDAPEACDFGFPFGEVEDYCVHISEGVPPACDIPEVLNIVTSDIGEATLEWQEVPAALGYLCRIKKITSGNWLVVETPNPLITLADLSLCSDYEFEIKVLCGVVESEWSDRVQFTMPCPPPCGVTPTNLDTLSVHSNIAIVTWSPTPDAQHYRFQYRVKNAPSWSEFLTPGTSVELVDLEKCTIYDYAVQAICFDSESDTSVIANFQTDCKTSISSLQETVDRLIVFPNPFFTNFFVKIELEIPKRIQVELWNTQGQLVFKKMQTQATKHQVECTKGEALPAGVYFLKIQIGTEYIGQKIVKLAW